MAGEWKIDISRDLMPYGVVKGMEELNKLIGAEYTPIAYLGSQIVNGTNHAVLMRQNIVNGVDTTNIVVVIFYETKDGVSISNIERVVEGGPSLGGCQIEPTAEITEAADRSFKYVLERFLGATIKPFALLATQVTKGVNYVFAATITPVTPEANAKVAIVVVNPFERKASFTDILHSGLEISLGKPLNQWP